MEKNEVLEHIVNIHNTICKINVSGDDAIKMGSALLEIRSLAQSLGNDLNQVQVEQEGV